MIENCSVTAPFTLPLYANGMPTLMFLSSKGKLDGKSTSNLTLFGQTVFPETLIIEDNFILIAYFFKPFALFSLFGISAKELTDYPVDLSLLHPQQANQLKERLLNSSSVSNMIQLLDEYVFDLIRRTKTETQIIQYATSVIVQNPSKEKLIALQKELYITERTFERLFDKSIGVSPTLYRRICQFNAAFLQLQRRRFNKLTDIAFDNGYADQSHYIKTFKEFTNITPKDYLAFGDPGEE
jgi:AraC-like DNA-binding protein